MKKIALLILIFSFHLVSCSKQKNSQGESQQNSDFVIQNSEKEVVCFVYHRFGDNRFPTTNVSVENFEAHLNYLKSNDFQVLTFSGAIDYLQSSEPARKTAVITIDDGYENFMKRGLPLLRTYDFPATLFINTETVGGADYMGWSEIKAAMDQGIEIGNHTHSHQYFLNLPEIERYKTFEDELKLTQQMIEENLGYTPTTFAYPYGELDKEMVSIVRDLGFKAAAAQNSGVIHSKTNLLKCPRFPMSEFYAEPEKFANKAKMKALVIEAQQPKNHVLSPNETKPKLELEFNKANLLPEQIQCFIQGGKALKNWKEEDGVIKLIIEPEDRITNRRRTLYTVTVPDENDDWHWFSHLWIRPD